MFWGLVLNKFWDCQNVLYIYFSVEDDILVFELKKMMQYSTAQSSFLSVLLRLFQCSGEIEFFLCFVIGLTLNNRACRQRTGTPKFRGSGCQFPRANAILTRTQALLWDTRLRLFGITDRVVFEDGPESSE